MTRRRRGACLTAISVKDTLEIESAIRALRDRVLAYHTTDLTCDDILHIFIKAEHHVLARECVSVLKKEPDERFELRRGEYNLTVFLRKSNFVFPSYMGGPVFDGERFEKVTAWIERRIEIGREFSIVQEALNYLNDRCKDAATMRFLWPGFAGLAGYAGLDLVDKVRNARIPKHIPTLPIELKDALREASTTIIKATMLPADGKFWRDGQEVKLALDTGSYAAHRKPWNRDVVMVRM